jgi:hypothetical protein
VPVLKWKGAEQKAVLDLRSWTQGRYTPLIEFVPPPLPPLPQKRKDGSRAPQKPHDPGRSALKHIEAGLKALSKTHFTVYPFFLDPHILRGKKTSDDEDCWAYVVRAAKVMSLLSVPVIRLSATEEEMRLAAASAGARGVALRVVRSDLWPRSGKTETTARGAASSNPAPAVGTKVRAIQQHGYVRHLILDLGSLEDVSAKIVETLMGKALSVVQSPETWQTLTIAGGAFPVSTSRVPKNEDGLVDRVDLIGWDAMRSHSESGRVPTFADYVVQNPVAIEPDPTKPIKPYAAIRYTLLDAWLLVKGKQLDAKGSGKQFIQLAERLAQNKRFLKPSHCEGCRHVIDTKEEGAEAVLGLPGWRHWSTVHHITLTLEQMEALPAE